MKRLGPYHRKVITKIYWKYKSCSFNASAWFERKPWINQFSLYIYVLFLHLLFGVEEAWTRSGISNLKHCSKRAQKHEASSKDVTNKLQLETFGVANNASSLSEEHR